MDEDAQNELRTGEVRKDEMQPLLNSTELKFQSSDYNIYRIHDDRNEQQEHNDDCPSSSDDDSNAPEETDAPQSSPAEAAASISPNAADARNKFDATRRATGNRVRLSVLQARDAVSDEVRRAKELGFIGIAKEIGRWMKAHPAETAAIIVFVVVMASTPAILAAMGFTTAGIAAGSTAAVIQSGIGSVVAGSAFAICQSAMMAGCRAFIFIVLPLLSSAIGWAVMKAWRWYNSDWAGNEGEAEPDSLEGEGDGGGGELVISASPGPGSATNARETLSDVKDAMKLVAILAVGSVVYRYRRWRRSRE